ncbi:aspartate kinase [Ileibacterium valens]|uniref:aspartate kinase n=2 Tax=Ileibacterium valens TaxID=1862668 RepID=UPI00272C060F|nr:aspartate kinase [Ileibacterium valens]
MSLKITKFGGSSVAQASQFKKVRDIIQTDPDRRYVVVSAPGKRFSNDSKITDLLYLLDAHRTYHVDGSNVFRLIKERFLEIKEELGLKQPIEKELDQLYTNLSSYSQNELVSRGEYFCAKLMAEYLGFPFVDAADVIRLNLDKSIDWEATRARLQAKMNEYEHFVFPGFYGTSANNKIQVFSRGGGDITGSILANAMGADVYENWTDVSGFLMADPRIVPNPKEITHITYSELRELSYMGASVLHEEAIFPVKETNTPIHILNTNRPDDAGTIIQETSNAPRKYPITGIAGKPGFLSIYVYKKHMSNEIGYMRKVLSILERYNVSIEHIPSGIDSFSIVVSSAEVGDCLYEILHRIKKEVAPDELKITDHIALISTVGKAMSHVPGMAGRLFDALGRERISINMIAQDSNEINITIGVDEKDLEKTIRIIYDEFVTD